MAALIVVACGIFGFFFPGGNMTWREPGAIIVEEDTGATYVYDASSGVLRPVINHASALLLTGPNSEVRSVSSKSLRGVPHGLPIGIPGAPDSLPAVGRLERGPWLVCATSQIDVSGTARPAVTIAIGVSELMEASAVTAAVLVSAADEKYLLWNGRRLRVAGKAAMVALGLEQTHPVPVTQAWLNGVPAGPDLATPVVAGRGGPGPTLDGRLTRVGQVLRVSGLDSATTDYRLVLADGLATLTTTQAQLILADPATRAAYDASPAPIDVGSATVVATARSATSLEAAGWPAKPPALLDPGQLGERKLCSRTRFGPDGGQDLVIASLARVRVFPLPTATAADRTAGFVAIAAGSGVLARPETAPGHAGVSIWLITDVGLRFALSSDAVNALGYSGVSPVDVPSLLLSLMPTGPTLDPTAAANEAWAGPTS